MALVTACKKTEPQPEAGGSGRRLPVADRPVRRRARSCATRSRASRPSRPAQKELVYYLSQAALCGRDIIFDQNYKHNLIDPQDPGRDRRGLQGRPERPPLGQVHDLRQAGLVLQRHPPPLFLRQVHARVHADYFAALVKGSEGVSFPLAEGQTLDDLLAFLKPILFDPAVDAKKVSQDSTKDLVTNSAVNFYEGVTQAEVENYYKGIVDKKDPTPISYGLNSRLVKKDGQVVEEVASIDGLYGPAIAKIVFWLEKAAGVAENDQQKKVIETLIEYYRTGDLKKFDEYNVLWVGDTAVAGSTSSTASSRSTTTRWAARRPGSRWSTSRTSRPPSGPTPSRPTPSGSRTTRRSIPGSRRKRSRASRPRSSPRPCSAATAIPSTPIGINLPNANWIRKAHGSKSVTLENITYAYAQSSLESGFGPEFCASPEELERSRTVRRPGRQHPHRPARGPRPRLGPAPARRLGRSRSRTTTRRSRRPGPTSSPSTTSWTPR